MTSSAAPSGDWPRHAPDGYACPFCELVAGRIESPENLCVAEDLVYVDDEVAVLIACDGFGQHEGHAMVVPARHFETLYELPDSTASAIMLATRRVAVAMKAAWNPDGVSTRQHNEPAGNQHVWHYHQHVFPRYHGDELYRQLRHRVPVEVRARKARELRAALGFAS